MRSTHSLPILHIAICVTLASAVKAQSVDDHRSINSGTWTNGSIWERYDGTNWVPASAAPSTASGVITIRNGHTIALAGPMTIDQLVVASGGSLTTASFANLTVADGPGTDLLILGTFAHTGSILYGPGSIVVGSGGLIALAGGSYLAAGAVLDIEAGGGATSTDNFFLNGIVNNAGTWSMQGGALVTNGSNEKTFNNLAGGVLNLNGWSGSSYPISSITVNNDGTIEQNNSPVEFTWWNGTLNNSGTLNVNGGSLRQSSSTITNTGVFAFSAGSALRLSDGTFTNSAGGSLNDLPHLIVEYGTLNLNAGSTCDDLPLITQTNGSIAFGIPVNVLQYDLTQGNFTGPAEVTIPPGGVFNLNNGYVNPGGSLRIMSGATANTNGTVYIDGTVNNEGTWNMVSGRTHTTGFGVSIFNNLPGGVINLNGWADNTVSWSFTDLNNAGTVNKNNGTVLFTFWNTPFVNLPGGVFNALAGETRFVSSTFSPSAGTFNIPAGATLSGDSDLNFAGATIANDGAIIAPNAVITGTTGSTLSGTGHIRHLRMNGGADLALGSDHTVDSVLTLTAGRIITGQHDLMLLRAGASSLVGGSASSHVATTGPGGLKRTVNATAHLFPVGTDASYMPVTMSSLTGPVEQITARVTDAVSTAYGLPGEATGLPVTQHNVLGTWVITEATNGGNSAQLTFQWNASDEGAGFMRNTCAVLAYDGAAWGAADAFNAAEGTGPFTRTGGPFDAFREFTVGDPASLTLTLDVQEGAAVTGLRAFPNPMTDRLTIVSASGPLHAFELHDATGRLVRSGTINAPRFALERNGLNAGAYVLNVRTAREMHTVRVVVD